MRRRNYIVITDFNLSIDLLNHSKVLKQITTTHVLMTIKLMSPRIFYSRSSWRIRLRRPYRVRSRFWMRSKESGSVILSCYLMIRTFSWNLKIVMLLLKTRIRKQLCKLNWRLKIWLCMILKSIRDPSKHISYLRQKRHSKEHFTSIKESCSLAGPQTRVDVNWSRNPSNLTLWVSLQI